MKTDRIKNLKLQKILSILIFIIGLVLLLYMILAEDEPGAIPLLLIVFGLGWYFISKSRYRSQNM